MKVQRSISPALTASTAKDVPVGRFFTYKGEFFIYLRVANGCVRFNDEGNPVYIPEESIGDSQWRNPTVKGEDFCVILGGN